MKLKSLLSISSIFVLLAILVSSCGSTLNITKKRHSNGYYVNIGNDSHDGTNKSDQKKNKKSDLADLINEKSSNDDMASNVEGSDEADGENSKSDNETNAKSLSAEQLAAAEEFSKMSTLKKIKALKNAKKAGKLDDNTDFYFVLLVLLALILSPIAVFMHGDGISTHFWINLVMWLLGVGYVISPLLGILLLVAVVHALLYIFGVID